MILFNITEKEEGNLEAKDDATIDNTEEYFKEKALSVLDVIYLYQKTIVSRNYFMFKYLRQCIFIRGGSKLGGMLSSLVNSYVTWHSLSYCIAPVSSSV